MTNNSKVITLNRSQALIHMVNANVTYALWPRASGKTTGGMGPRIERLSNVMPRCQIILYSDTYDRIQDRIIPNVVSFWEQELGLVEGLDFVKFKKPPEHWTKPLIPLDKYDHVISFATGTALCCASQKVPGSANAYNAQALIVDETKYVREEKINTEVLPALRGALRYFGHLPEYRSHWYFTDKWPGRGAEIKWLLAKRKLMNPQLVDAVISAQVELNVLIAQHESCTSSRTKAKYNAQIIELENKLNAVRRNMVFVSEAIPYENRYDATLNPTGALNDKYFRDLRRDLSDYEYRVAILNEDPDKVVNTFYPALNREVHYYQQYHDVDTTAPLACAFDYNWRITPMAVGQYGTLPGEAHRTFNVVAGVHTLHPHGGIKATCKAFADNYATHQNKTIHFIFDHTAIGKHPDADPYYIQVTQELQKHGWTVIQHYIGQAPEHGDKFNVIQNLMARTGEDSVRINQLRGEALCLSIQQAGAITTGGKTKKDKSKEKDLNYPAEETTDYSDAFDTLLWGCLQLKKVLPGSQAHGTGFAIS